MNNINKIFAMQLVFTSSCIFVSIDAMLLPRYGQYGRYAAGRVNVPMQQQYRYGSTDSQKPTTTQIVDKEAKKSQSWGDWLGSLWGGSKGATQEKKIAVLRYVPKGGMFNFRRPAAKGNIYDYRVDKITKQEAIQELDFLEKRQDALESRLKYATMGDDLVGIKTLSGEVKDNDMERRFLFNQLLKNE